MPDDKQPLINSRNWGLLIGIPFTIFVVGLIVYGNFFASSSHDQHFTWEYRPELHVCDTAPEWAKPGHKDFNQARDFWKARGWSYSKVTVGPCPKICDFKDPDTGKTRSVACNTGKVTIDLRDQWFKEDHAGECVRPASKDVLRDNDWVTILLPSVIYGITEFPEEFGAEVPMLPPDVNAMTLAHEEGHCLVGIGHNEGPPVGCARLNSKTGSVMNPTIYGGGWVDEALPSPPTEWD
jgi:hypothetical protein